MKIKILFFSLISFISFYSTNAQQKNDFSGSWILNTQKTDYGKVDPKLAAASTVIIKQTNSSLELIRTFPDASHADETYQFDGTVIDTTMGDYKRSSYLKWSDDQKQFTISSVYNVTPLGKAPWQFTRTESYTLSSDDKILTIERISIFPDRTDSVKAEYDKK